MGENIEKDIREEKYYKRLKLQLEELENKRKGKFPIYFGVISGLVTFGISYLFFIDSHEYGSNTLTIIVSILMGLVVGLFVSMYIVMCIHFFENRVRREILDLEVQNVQNKVKEDIFENSIKMSYKYLDQYYYQTREQAQKGFFVTVCISVFGAILIGVGIGAMFLGKVSPSYITCASGVATEFISAIFFYLYNKTIASMSKYHNKLVLSQNISIALKVAGTLPSDDKIKAKNVIIQELLKNINSHLTKSDDENKKK